MKDKQMKENIPKRLELLEDLGRMLADERFGRTHFGCLEVAMFRDDDLVTQCGIDHAITVLVCDLWQDGDANDVRGLNRIEVRTI